MIVFWLGALGVLIGGPVGGLFGVGFGYLVLRSRRRPAPPPPISLVLLLLLVELRSGLSVLASLGNVASVLPADVDLSRVYQVARVAGLTESLAHAGRLRPVIVQLARSQRSGASLAGVVTRMIETELQESRTNQIARARTLPVKLMVPVTLFMLPGLVLMLYAPSLLAMFEDLTGGLS